VYIVSVISIRQPPSSVITAATGEDVEQKLTQSMEVHWSASILKFVSQSRQLN